MSAPCVTTQSIDTPLSEWPLTLAAHCGHLEEVERLLLLGGYRSEDFFESLVAGAQNGNAQVLRTILSFGDPMAKLSSRALRAAAAGGHMESAKLLIHRSNPKALDSEALQSAAAWGHLAMVELLLPFSDPKAMCSYALAIAAASGHMDIVRLLKPVSDPKAGKSMALVYAVMHEQFDCALELIAVSNPSEAFIELFYQQCPSMNFLRPYVSLVSLQAVADACDPSEVDLEKRAALGALLQEISLQSTMEAPNTARSSSRL